ncbi:MAG: lysylphosphatidylglycerol synthase domain-containing protein [Bacteroidota bacterium]
MKKLPPKLFFGLKVLASLALVFVVIRNISVEQLFAVIGSVPLWFWCVSIMLMFLSQVIAAKRWHVLSDHVSFGLLLRLTLISNVYAFMIPSVLTADAARLVGVPKSDDGWTGATSRLVVDKVVGLASVLVLGMPALLLTTSNQLRQLFIPSLLLVGLIIIVITISRLHRFHQSLSKLEQALAGRGGRSLMLLSKIVGVVINTRLKLPNRVLLVNGLLALSFQLIMVVMLALGAQVCAIRVEIQDLVILSAATQLAFFVPVGIGGVGVKEVTQVAILVTLGVSKQNEVTMASLWYPLVLLMGATGGVYILVDQRKKNRVPIQMQ